MRSTKQSVFLRTREYYQGLKYLIRDTLDQTSLPEARGSYSQCGEDRIVRFICLELGLNKPTYLDIGANHPKRLSNTYLFYRHGSSGVCIEPNPVLWENFSRIRPRDVCLNLGIGENVFDSLPFYCFGPEADGLSSFSKEQAEASARRHGFEVESVIKIPVRSLSTVMEDYFKSSPPDFLTIDVEGSELKILETLNFTTHAPKIICAETHYPGANKTSKNEALISFLESQEYQVFADTFLNTIFVKKELFPKL